MKPFHVIAGPAVPLIKDDINTDQMAPASVREGANYGDLFFERSRRDPDFVLNQERFKAAKILVTGNNFGCGSTRESAVWALMGFGIGCVVARSFADIFRENCLKNGVLPIVLPSTDADAFEKAVVAVDGTQPYRVDLEARRITCPRLGKIVFDIADNEREALLKGVDDIDFTLGYADAISDWERSTKSRAPWLQRIGASR